MPPRKSEFRPSPSTLRPSALKHQVVFAPAGSGKTERLSGRYIELLEAGVKPERILTLTFTEKAAAEMKDRIFDRLSKKNPELFEMLRNNALKLRISTIHAFCLSLVKRFGPLAGMDPRLEVLADPETTWQSAKYDALMRVAERERGTPTYDSLMELVTRDQVQGWSRLSGLFDSFFSRRIAIARARPVGIDQARLDALSRALAANECGRKLPDYRHLFPKKWDAASRAAVAELLDRHADVYLTRAGDPRKRGCSEEEQEWNRQMAEYRMLVRTGAWYDEFSRSFALFRNPFLAAYTRAKNESGQVDYDDMESLALQLIADNPEWQNILYAFDEHTDHLLVDEFQDTSFIQWRIIDRLTEEWRAGEGAKADRAVEPTVFIVGDDKQSIYMFRDAKVEVFTTAADKLEEWVGKEKLERVTLHDNYRSLQSVIDFTNALFSGLMAPPSDQSTINNLQSTMSEPWRTRYSEFERARKNTSPGMVEVLLDRFEGKAADCRQRDAENICRRIRSLVTEPFTVFDRDEKPRFCEFRDIAILIRSRTHLEAIEQALLDGNIPYLVLGGTGFYSEPEVEYLRSLLSFLCDPTDDVALYITLRGPFFNVAERDLFLANSASASSFDIRHSTFDIFLWDRIRACPGPALEKPVAALSRWLALVQRVPLARIIEQAMAERRVWEVFWEPQREANCRKFITVIENLEAAGSHPLRILRELEQAGSDEPKADVRTEGRNAVQVLTIHAAKGLQFPVVFVPGLDEKLRAARGAGDPLVIEEISPDEVLFSYIPESAARRASEFHMTHVAKELEEEKRVFYVACTRARDALILSGIWNKKAQEGTRLEWLTEHLGLAESEGGFALAQPIPAVLCTDAASLPPGQVAASGSPLDIRSSSFAIRPSGPPPKVVPPPALVSVTRNLPTDFRRAPSDESIGTGDIIHRLLEMISDSELTADSPQLKAEIARQLRLNGLPSSLAANLQSTIYNLRSDPAVWSAVAPRPGGEAELPIMYSDGQTTFTGRIDRLILTDTEARVCDYKTFPVKKADIPGLVKEYHEGQLQHYADAVRRLYPGKKVTTFLIFTALPLIVPTP
jgi:ATP-dependent helicase/nuclease subunit A